MAYYRRLPSGKWQATVRGPDGRKHTRSDKLRDVVKKWATDQEAKFNRGEVRDPRAGDIRVGDWHKRYVAAAVVEAPTVKKNASLWSVHCEEKWAGWKMSAPTRMEAQGWVGELRAKRLSAATIADIVHIM